MLVNRVFILVFKEQMIMSKLLLIGFTETNANVIQIFIEMTFKDIVVEKIIRQLDVASLTLPVLTDEQLLSDIFVIDFEGAGLSLADKGISSKLEIYTGGKPILFVSRKSHVIPMSLMIHYEWLSVPYNRQQMTESVKNLLANIQPKSSLKQKKIDTKANSQELLKKPFHINHTSNPTGTGVVTCSSVSQQKEILPENQATLEEVKKVFDTLLSVFPEMIQQPFFHFTRQLQLSHDFTKIVVNHHELYLNPVDKSVILLNLERVADSFVVGLSEETIVFERVDNTIFRKNVNNLLAQGAKQYNLSQLIWVIGIEIIQVRRNAYSQSHNLRFEALYMPNISGIKFAPKYIVPLIASCLGRPRVLSDFNTLFPYLTNAQINQIMILLTMSQAVNVNILFDSAKSQLAESQQSINTTQNSNQGVQKASKTGFLRRLLNKLGM